MREQHAVFMPLGLLKKCISDQLFPEVEKHGSEELGKYFEKLDYHLDHKKDCLERLREALDYERAEIESELEDNQNAIELLVEEIRTFEPEFKEEQLEERSEELIAEGKRFVGGKFSYRKINSFPKGCILYARAGDKNQDEVISVSKMQSANHLPNHGFVTVNSTDDFTALPFYLNGDLLENYQPESNDVDKSFMFDEIMASEDFRARLIKGKSFSGQKMHDYILKWHQENNSVESFDDSAFHLIGGAAIEFLSTGKGIGSPGKRAKCLQDNREKENWILKALGDMKGYIVGNGSKKGGKGGKEKSNDNWPNTAYRGMMEIWQERFNTPRLPLYIGELQDFAGENQRFSKKLIGYRNTRHTKLTDKSSFYSLRRQLEHKLLEERVLLQDGDRWASYSMLASAMILFGVDVYMNIKETLQVPAELGTVWAEPVQNRFNEILEGGELDYLNLDWRARSRKILIEEVPEARRNFEPTHIINNNNFEFLLRQVQKAYFVQQEKEYIEKFAEFVPVNEIQMNDVIADGLAKKSDEFGGKQHELVDIRLDQDELILESIPYFTSDPDEQKSIRDWLESEHTAIHDSQENDSPSTQMSEQQFNQLKKENKKKEKVFTKWLTFLASTFAPNEALAMVVWLELDDSHGFKENESEYGSGKRKLRKELKEFGNEERLEKLPDEFKKLSIERQTALVMSLGWSIDVMVQKEVFEDRLETVKDLKSRASESLLIDAYRKLLSHLFA